MRIEAFKEREFIEDLLSKVSERVSSLREADSEELSTVLQNCEEHADNLLEDILDDVTIWLVKATPVEELGNKSISDFIDEISLYYFDLADCMINMSDYSICDSLVHIFLSHIKLMADVSNTYECELYEQTASALYTVSKLILIAYMIAIDKDDIIGQFKEWRK